MKTPVEKYDYPLPPELIAQNPLSSRTDSRLLVLDRSTGAVKDKLFKDLPDLLNGNDLLVVNDSRVFHARLFGKRPTGGKVEIFLLKRIGDHRWEALIRPLGRFTAGDPILLEGGQELRFEFRTSWDGAVVSFPGELDDEAFVEEHGHVPLPPYIKRGDHLTDRERYQTVFARAQGSSAAPTAGLHFDEPLLMRLKAKGVAVETVTLHVGLGTFQPVMVDYVEDHPIHSENYLLSAETTDRIEEAKAAGRRIIAVGTTTTRVLETYARTKALQGETSLYIHPPFTFEMVDALITNFHLPRSSLLMLAHAFAGDAVFEAYRHAVEDRYRFFSYGDAMLIE